MSICVIIADSSKARFLFAPGGHDPLQDEQDFIHPASRLREQDLVTDGSGSGGDSRGLGKHSMGHERSAREQEAINFTRELSAKIDKIRQHSDLRRIYLVAAPKFLGLLRANLSRQCSELVAGEVNKDLVGHNIDEIRTHLPRIL